MGKREYRLKRLTGKNGEAIPTDKKAGRPRKAYSVKPNELLGISPLDGTGEEKDRYTDRVPAYVEGLALLGLTDKRIAEHLKISIPTLNKWKKEYPGLVKALSAGREIADIEVADALYRAAVGYSKSVDDIRVVKNGDGKTSRVVKTKVTKYYPPNISAVIFWLKNRRRDTWRDSSRVELTGEDGKPLIDLGPLSDSELLIAAKVGLKPVTKGKPKETQARLSSRTDSKTG